MGSPESNDNKKNDNFFNKNPLITFAIFSIVIILLFKSLMGDQGEAGSMGSAMGTTSQNKQVSYSELKSLVLQKKVQKVEIGQSYIRAMGSDGSKQITYTTRIVGNDNTLVPLLDKENIDYSGF